MTLAGHDSPVRYALLNRTGIRLAMCLFEIKWQRLNFRGLKRTAVFQIR
jgi:hypothetical protein